ncbi:hypothetical protein ACET76_10665 [Aeromonas caviae]|uniref:hypothetical protein n=1 Tax=Aeromonas caviae TaxID=648 RepID=UPI002B476AAC|nr:hypothetical protein [Aeromonas caviae]
MTNQAQFVFKQIMPADGWFLREELEGGKYRNIQLAAWALTEEGNVIGLVVGEGPSLWPVTTGCYIHQKELDKLNTYLSPKVAR